MKYVLTIMALIISHFLFGQTTGYFRYDSTRFEKVGGNNELILLNGTRSVTGGVLTNLGNGRTAFVTPPSGGSPNTSIGGAFRIAVNSTNNVKSLREKFGITLDSATTGEVGVGADTSTIQPKNLSYPNSVEKSGITVRLVNDANTDSTMYANIGTKGWKNASVIDVTGGTQGQSVVWLGGKLFGLSSITAGAQQPYKIQYQIGSHPNAPPAGDSIIVCDSLDGKGIQFYRQGDLQYEGNNLQGYTISNDTLYVHPPFVTGEMDQIFIWNDPIDTAQLCEPPDPPEVWSSIDFPTNTNLSETADEWTGTSNDNWDHYGLSGSTLTADGSIAMQYAGTATKECILGFNASNTSQSFSGYEYGIYLGTGGALTRIVNGSPTSLGVSISVGDWVRINRTGSTFKIQTSTDKTLWTDQYTFAATSSATHYINLAVFRAGATVGKCSFPEGLGLTP
jgi:hypothetical protein